MEVKIVRKTENKLLHRVELAGNINFTGATPSHKELEEELSKLLKVKPEVIMIKHVYTNFGSQTARFEAFIYDSVEKLVSIERKEKQSDKLKEENSEKQTEESVEENKSKSEQKVE